MTMNETTKKVTKKEMFEEIKAILESSPNMVPTELVEFINNEIEALNKKAEAARKARDKKKTEVDTLLEEVFACLNDTSFTVIPQIMKNFEDNEDITSAKVTARLTKLVRENKVEKDSVNVAAEGEKKKVLTGYRIIK
jgi:hypothetical protein